MKWKSQPDNQMESFTVFANCDREMPSTAYEVEVATR